MIVIMIKDVLIYSRLRPYGNIIYQHTYSQIVVWHYGARSWTEEEECSSMEIVGGICKKESGKVKCPD